LIVIDLIIIWCRWTPMRRRKDQPATLKKAQDAAAARKDGEEVGSSGKHTIHVPPVIRFVMGTCCSWLVICQMGVEQHDSFCGMQVLIP